MGVRQFLLPDPGEGLTEAEIVTWRVAVGDTVKVNDIVVEIETAKSLVELPIPWAGTVTALLVPEGASVEVGSPIIAIDDPAYADGAPPAAASPAASPAPSPAPAPAPAPAVPSGVIGEPTATGRTAVLVGYGVKPTEAVRRPRRKDALVRTVAAPPGAHVDSEPRMGIGELVGAHARRSAATRGHSPSSPPDRPDRPSTATSWPSHRSASTRKTAASTSPQSRRAARLSPAPTSTPTSAPRPVPTNRQVRQRHTRRWPQVCRVRSANGARPVSRSRVCGR